MRTEMPIHASLCRDGRELGNYTRERPLHCLSEIFSGSFSSSKEGLEMSEKDDAQRYRDLRYWLLMGDTMDFGEAYVRVRVIGEAPTLEDFDAAVDALDCAPERP